MYGLVGMLSFSLSLSCCCYFFVLLLSCLCVSFFRPSSPPLHLVSSAVFGVAALKQKAAQVPSLTSAVERLVKEKGRAEDAVGAEGKRTSDERRRSKAWREQVDQLSSQVRRK